MDDSRKCAHCGQAMTEAAERYVAEREREAVKTMQSWPEYAEAERAKAERAGK